MFDSLMKKFRGVFEGIARRGVLTETDLETALNELKSSLLDADVHYDTVNEFIKEVQQKALGAKIHKALSPSEQLTKIVHQTLTDILGTANSPLELKGTPSIIMLVGLQGSGKTTTAVKLAKHIKQKMGRSPMVVGVDFNRPAALQQLAFFAQNNDIAHYTQASKSAIESVKKAKEQAKINNNDVIIIDTAGRLQIDAVLMNELKELKNEYTPSEILLVVDSMIGRDAVNVAKEFNSLLDLSGFILTKLDSDAKGGSALSLYKSIAKPIKFAGIGEKADALEMFYPDRMASRILDLGDIMTLIEKAQHSYDEKEAQRLEKKLKKNEFDIEDFLAQIQQLKKLGSMESLLSFMPGFSALKGKLKGLTPPDKELKKIEAIISSMTIKERQTPNIINGNRRKRIALGSGTTVNDVNKFLKSFDDMKKLMKSLPKSGFSGLGIPKLR
jgi:signal recognition particle subunit SRP54